MNFIRLHEHDHVGNCTYLLVYLKHWPWKQLLPGTTIQLACLTCQKLESMLHSLHETQLMPTLERIGFDP